MNTEVTRFLDDLSHPFRKEIEAIRGMVLKAYPGMEEDIKWNGPNYRLGDKDRISIRVHPPKNIQVIFHCGSKVQQEPDEKLIKEDYSFLQWRTNDRAVATFKDAASFKQSKNELQKLIKDWLAITLP